MEYSKLRFQNKTGHRKNVLYFKGYIPVLIAVSFLFPGTRVLADDFGEIGVSADAMYSGNTYHGYAETRVTVENHSRTKNHSVTLIAPNQVYGSGGNSISRLSRSVEVAPGAIKIVSLLQPPLPETGDSRIRVEVDSGDGGEISAPRNVHCQFNYYDHTIIPNLFVSRTLDFNQVEGIFNLDLKAFTADMAIGPPDAGRSLGRNQNAWMPNTSTRETNWLELDFASPMNAAELQIYHTLPLPPSGEVLLLDDSNTVLDRDFMKSTATGPTRRGRSVHDMTSTRLSFPETTKPVKTVRLNFGTVDPKTISIDAVELSGPSGSAYASAARASSDDHGSALPLPGRVPGRPNPEVQTLRAELAVSDWSDNWLAYTPFDGIALSAADLATLPPPVANALTAYLFAGGNIFLFGDRAVNSIPESWRGGRKDFAVGAQGANVGFGRCVLMPDLLVKKAVNSIEFQNLRTSLRDTARYWGSLPDSSEAANGQLPVVKNVKIPARGIVAFMLLFILIVGPLNLFILKRRKQTIAILWTIPAISAVTTLALFAYSLLREGITPDTRITGLTFLEQASHRATTIGASGFYCPLTPSGGLAFDYGTEVTPLIGFDPRYGTQREVDWTQAQHFRRGWVSARVPAIFHLRKSEIRRERLQVQKDNGQLKIVNGLGAPIESLWLAAANGKIYHAHNVAAGQMATLSEISETVTAERPDAEALLHDLSFATHVEYLTPNVTKYLSRGSYVAQLQGNPFIENSLGTAASPLRSKLESVVLGQLEPSETP